MTLYSSAIPNFSNIRVSTTSDTGELVLGAWSTTHVFTAVIRFIIHGKHCRAQIEVAARRDILYDSLRSGLIIIQERKNANVRQPTIVAPDKELTLLSISPQNLPASKEVLDALYNIETTPYDHSFLSRLRGSRSFVPPGLVAVDSETRTPWMNLMADIREHYLFAQFV